MNDIYIVAYGRTPMGSFNGSLSSLSATQLGAQVIQGLIIQQPDLKKEVNEVFMGNVLSAGLGQAPARQAAIYGGLSDSTPSTTINKVCASGMKAIMLGAQSIALGHNNVVIAGGMESMSNVPHYLLGSRNGYKLGHQQLSDGLLLDGLTDVYNAYHMGNAAELCAKECAISREDQDEYAIQSYQRSANAWANGKFDKEIINTLVPQRRGPDLTIKEDEEYRNVKFDKIPELRPVFQKDGTVTAANASTINDGAAGVMLASKEIVDKYNLTPLAKIIGFSDAASAPEWFTTAPAKALPLAIKRAGLTPSDIDFYEINEAFSVVSLANMKELKLSAENTNIYGGAVSLGHPLGCSGARIIVTLISVLNQEGGKYGAAGICNGGGGASAVVIEKC